MVCVLTHDEKRNKCTETTNYNGSLISVETIKAQLPLRAKPQNVLNDDFRKDKPKLETWCKPQENCMMKRKIIDKGSGVDRKKIYKQVLNQKKPILQRKLRNQII